MLKKNERGSIMVEVLAVIALMGLMGTVLYRQIQHRNEELDNINMASEIRMVKEATTAYIQDHRATLEQMEFCTDDGADYMQANVDDIDGYMPTNWACDVVNGQPNGNCLINEFTIWLACDPVGTSDRKMIWGLVVPNADNLPQHFNLRRAARVANLIGADGGIHDGGTLYGTQGAWEVTCGDPCNDREDAFHVATTGVDVYIPEVEASAANAVAIPNSLALNILHSNSYFSVGKNFNCIGNYDATAERYAHEDLIDNVAAKDTILHVGGGDDPNSLCDPLFWVGAKGPDPDHSDSNHVYVKNNLYVGRDNAHQRQAIALETGDDNTSRQIVVYDKDGIDTLTLNANGQIIGRTNESTGQGYELNAETGEINLFSEYSMTLDDVEGKVRVPGLRLSKDGKILTGVMGRYYDDGNNQQTEEYGVDPAGTSLMHDVRLTSRGGARLSEILPNYIAKGIETVTQNSATTNTVEKPTCPKGYVRAITVTPIKYSQYVTSVKLQLGETGEGSATAGHKHPIAAIDATANSDTKDVTDSASKLTLKQFAPVTIGITDGSGEPATWVIDLKYGTTSPSSTDPISALAQTYCVYTPDADTATSASTDTPFKRDARGENNDMLTVTSCTPATADVCSDGECVDGLCRPKKCTENDGVAVDAANHIYCFGGRQMYVECLTTSQCGEGKLCGTDYRCVDAPVTPEPEPAP